MQDQCYLRVAVKSCVSGVEILMMGGDLVVSRHMPPGEQQVCLPLSCDSKRRSTRRATLLVDTYQPGNQAVVAPNNVFKEGYGKLYTTMEECKWGEKDDAQIMCTNVAVATGEMDSTGRKCEHLSPCLNLSVYFCYLHSDSGSFGAHTQWQNDYDKGLHVECPEGHAFNRVQSKHDNSKEDRVWQWDCTSIASTNWEGCEWSGYQNEFDLPLFYQCPADYVMTGVDSYHDNGPEDRRWSFRCCKAPNHIAQQCSLSGWINDFDASMDYKVNSPRVFAGAYSHHNNGKE